LCLVEAIDFLHFEPGTALRMFSADFWHYYFLITYTMDRRQVAMTTPNSGPFFLSGPETQFPGLK